MRCELRRPVSGRAQRAQKPSAEVPQSSRRTRIYRKLFIQEREEKVKCDLVLLADYNRETGRVFFRLISKEQDIKRRELIAMCERYRPEQLKSKEN